MIDWTRTALLLVDLQNDFLHPDGAYARGGAVSPEAAALPPRLAPLAAAMRRAGGLVAATQFTLVPGRGGEPMISPHLRQLRPFLRRGDFLPGSWGHGVKEVLAPIDLAVEKVVYSAFYMTRLEWVLLVGGFRWSSWAAARPGWSRRWRRTMPGRTFSSSSAMHCPRAPPRYPPG